MKFRLIAVFLILFVAAWLPIIAQQNVPPASAGQQAQAGPSSTNPDKTSDKSSCTCCAALSSPSQGAKSEASGCCHGKDAKAGHSMPCCEGKDASGMTCCKKDGQAKQVAATCCKGKDGKMCAKQDGKGCCDASACKSCCTQNVATKSNDPCCTGANCCHGQSNA